MVSYRLEEASTGRAGCQNKECKDAKSKILKGELRHGSWVDNDRIQAFLWRHWGCVTPRIIASLNEIVQEDSGGDGKEKDYTVLDGYEDLSTENQEKVRRALEQGHVDDSEWRGDVEMNRPGMTGFRKRTPKKKAATEEKNEDEDETPKKKRGRGEAAAEEPAAKKTKRSGRTTKKAAEEKEDGEGGEPDASAAEAKPEPRRSRRSKIITEQTTQNEPKDTDGKPAAEEKPKRGRTRKASPKVESDEPEEKTAEKPKRGRKKAAASK